MEARKAAMVEASWCRILKAARIPSKEAEALLLKAEKCVAEAFEAATAMGVVMYDTPNCPQKPCEIKTSSIDGGESPTHAVAASFETAFEVDKQVAAAVKTAFIRLANCPSFNKDEFKDLLRKISQNPDTGESNQELSDFSSECESDTGSEAEPNFQKDDYSSQDLNCKTQVAEARQRKLKKKQLYENFNMTKLIDMMLERLKCLQEDELASLATIVATCGLNAALAEVENRKQHNLGSATDYSSGSAFNFARRMSSLGAGTLRNSDIPMNGQLRRKQAESEVPSLDKFLVKHLSKLEKEVLEAKNTRSNDSREGIGHNPDKSDDEKLISHNNVTSSEIIQDLGSILVKHSSKLEKEIEEAKKNSGKMLEKDRQNSESDMTFSETVPDLGSILVKHSSKLEKEIEETKRNCGKTYEMNGEKSGRMQNGVVRHTKQDVPEFPSLDKVLVKHVSRLEREVQEAKNRRNNVPVGGGKMANSEKKFDSSIPITPSEESENSLCYDARQAGKENIDLNKDVDGNVKTEQKDCTGESLKRVEQANVDAGETPSIQYEKAGIKEAENGLDKILVKPVHRLEREKMQALLSGSDHGLYRHQKKRGNNNITDCESLDKVLVKHVSRLEKEKMMRLHSEEEVVKVKKRSDATVQSEKHEEGSLDQILVKHKSRLEREKMAAAQQQPGEEIRHSITRRQARERELQEAWGGMSLGNSVRPHLSRLERDKAMKGRVEQKLRKI
ncbi:hypothetical protein L1049_015965 [Liquidambar formosana]|uniref:Uncharacterized protein n=1 Tax=Liquidambar formosana TaxID=63359 RepID=A0AAP0X062_LIQFO